jgi:hypothetical protein
MLEKEIIKKKKQIIDNKLQIISLKEKAINESRDLSIKDTTKITRLDHENDKLSLEIDKLNLQLQLERL